MQRAGMRSLSVQAGLRMLDAALVRSEVTLVPAALDLRALQRYSEQSALPALFRSLLRTRLRRAQVADVAGSALRTQLATLTDAERTVRPRRAFLLPESLPIPLPPILPCANELPYR